MRLSPPANLDDFSESSDPLLLRDAWEERIGNLLNARVVNTRRFFHPLKPPIEGPIVQAEPITWTGFPRAIELFTGALTDPSRKPEAFRLAEVTRPVSYVAVDGSLQLVSDRQRFPLVAKPWIDGAPQFGAADVIFQERQQDEYLEWAVVRSGGRATRIMFTAEGPEYWRTLALDPALLTKKYNELLFDGRSVVTTDDLYWQTDLALPSYREINLPNGSISVVLNRDQNGEPVYLPFETRGTYNQWNKWNTTDGCVHLIQRNNSLGAEINLAADSTYLYGTSSLTADPEEFMTCAGVGGIRRNSDPNIARDVNQNVLGNLSVTIADPIGLYISDFPQAGITFQGTDVTDQVLTNVRGQAGGDRQRVLRFELRAPEDGSYSLDQCVFDGNELDTGGPIALNTSISIYADAVASTRPNITDPRLGNHPCRFSSLCEHPDIVGYKAFPALRRNANGDLIELCSLVDWSSHLPYIPEDLGAPAATATMPMVGLPARTGFSVFEGEEVGSSRREGSDK